MWKLCLNRICRTYMLVIIGTIIRFGTTSIFPRVMMGISLRFFVEIDAFRMREPIMKEKEYREGEKQKKERNRVITVIDDVDDVTSDDQENMFAAADNDEKRLIVADDVTSDDQKNMFAAADSDEKRFLVADDVTSDDQKNMFTPPDNDEKRFVVADDDVFGEKTPIPERGIPDRGMPDNGLDEKKIDYQ